MRTTISPSPLSPRTLLACIRALTRRQPELRQTDALKYGDLRLEKTSFTLSCGERSVRLSRKEFDMMEMLMLNQKLVWVRRWSTCKPLAAVGQPLASVEGLIGMALASLLLALIALNCEESSAGMVVTFLWSLAVGAAQFMGVARIPFFMKSSVQSDDMAAGVLWSLYPVCISLMLGACALTIKSVRARACRETRMPLARVHRHAFGTTVALPAALAVSVLMVSASPSDTTNVAALGLEGVLAGHSMGHGLRWAQAWRLLCWLSVPDGQSRVHSWRPG